MSNIGQYVDKFLDELEVYEDLERGHNYKAFMRGAIHAFLEKETQDTAFDVYRQFFDSYRIVLRSEDGEDTEENKFIDLIDELRKYEATAATLIDKQRDHYIHAVNVFLTGLAIYTKNPLYRKAFRKAVPENDYRNAYYTKNEEFFYRWGIASLLHDVGYPVEITGHQINRFIRMLADADGDEIQVNAEIRYQNFDEMNQIKEVVPRAIYTEPFRKTCPYSFYLDLLKPLDLMAVHIHETFGTDLIETKKMLDGFLDKMAESGFIDHGYYSSLVVLKWYGFLMQKCGYKPEYFYWPVVDSATAILLHNYYRNVLQKQPFGLGPMKAEDNPIAFLLILCDELQEWNREAHGIVTKTFTLADNAHLSLTDEYLGITYITNIGNLPKDFCAEKNADIHTFLNVDEIFPKGFNVDDTSISSERELRDRLTEESSRPLLQDVELLAVAIHAMYNEKQLERHPDKALDYPDFSKLPDDLKYSNLLQAQDIYDKLTVMGYVLKPKGGKNPVTDFPDDLVEVMAEEEHKRWVDERTKSGWVLGPRDPEKKQSPYLIPYADLPDEIKEYDRDTIRNIPKLADLINKAVYSVD